MAEVIVCFAVVFGYLALGLIFLPMLLILVVVDPSPDVALVPGSIILALFGAMGLYAELNWTILEKLGRFGLIMVSTLLLMGLIALVPFAVEFADHERLSVGLAFVATLHIAYLGRDYQQANR